MTSTAFLVRVYVAMVHGHALVVFRLELMVCYSVLITSVLLSSHLVGMRGFVVSLTCFIMAATLVMSMMGGFVSSIAELVRSLRMHVIRMLTCGVLSLLFFLQTGWLIEFHSEHDLSTRCWLYSSKFRHPPEDSRSSH